MAHYSKPDLKQRMSLAGSKCPSCNEQGSIRRVFVDNAATSDVKCIKCSDTFTRQSESLRG